MGHSGKDKTFLTKLFEKAVKEPLTQLKQRPVKNGIVEPLHHVFGFFLMPFYSWKRFPQTIAVWAIAFPASLPLLPNGEEYLEDKGLDPAMASELSDVTIRVMQKDRRADRIHNLFNYPGIFIFKRNVETNIVPGAGGANSLWRVVFGSYGTCPVMLPSKNTTADSFARIMTGLKEDTRETAGMSHQAWFNYVTFHEFAHCHTENKGARVIKEGDADWRAYLMLEQITDEPALFETILYQRALALSEDHDTALYLDAMKNGMPPPSADEISGVWKEILHEMEKHHENGFRGLSLFDTTVFLNAMASGELGDLSPLARRRAELFVEAIRFFAPGVLGSEPDSKPEKQPEIAAPVIG